MTRYTLRSFTLQVADPGPKTPCSSVGAATAALRAMYADLDADQEHFSILALDNKARAVGFKSIFTGTANASLVHPREVFRAAIMLGACSIILAHNHPSGDPDPSDEDTQMTKRFVEAGRLLGIPVTDHIILGDGQAFSFKTSGMIP